MKQLTVVITRPDGEEFAELVSAAGFTAICAPLFSLEAVAGAISSSEDISSYNWIIFSSKNGVKFLSQSVSVLPVSTKIAVIGARTAAAVEKTFGRTADFCGDGESSERFSEQFLAQYKRGKSVLLAVGSERRGVIDAALARENIPVETRELYRQVELPIDSSVETQLSVVAPSDQLWTFFSPSAFQKAQALFFRWKTEPSQCKIFSIGKITSQAIAQAGYPVIAEATEQTEQGMIKALCQWRDGEK